MTIRKVGGFMSSMTDPRVPLRHDAVHSTGQSPGTRGSNGGSTGDASDRGSERLNTYSLQRLLDCFSILRDSTGNPELQMQTAVLFCYIAARHPNEVPQGEASQRLG